MSVNKKESFFFKEPNRIVQKKGKLDFSITLKCPKNFLATCIAMESLAKAEHRDDIVKRNGNDDYSISFGKLFNAFDTFIKELNKGRKSGGVDDIYDFSDPCEFTIYLLWQIRNVWTHHGGIVDQNCKVKYEKAKQNNKTKTILDLPDELEEGHEFTINFDEYKSIRKCIFNYIEKRVSNGDFKILFKRSIFTNINISRCIVSLPLNDYESIIFDLVEAYDCGCEIDPVTYIFKTPTSAKFDFKTELIILSNGKSFPAKLAKKNKQ